jgi:dihydrofolate reductase
MKASVFIATSLDGFIARKNGDIGWLGELEPGGEDYGYGKLVDGIDYLVMGRNTYEKVLTFGVWPYEKPVVVLTRRPLDIAAELASSVESMSGSPADIVAQLSDRGAQHLYVDGGKTIQDFLDAGQIQRLIITRIPVLLGDGISLFGPLQQDIKLRHIETQTFEDGNVQSEYVVT